MAEGAGRGGGLRRWRPFSALLAGWAAAPLIDSHASRVAHDAIVDLVYRVLAGFPAAALLAHRAVTTIFDGVAFTFGFTLFVASLGVPLAFAARMVARARVRAGHADPLDRSRRWTAAHPLGTAALLAALPTATQAIFIHWMNGWWWLPWPMLVGVAVACGLGQRAIARRGLRALLSPTLHGEEATAAPRAVDPDELHFDAVAVTAEAKGAVAALAAVSLGVAAWIASLPILSLFRDPRVFAVMGAYVGVAAGAALAFRRASRIAVGLDGVYVGGSSRPRFFAFRDVDEARERHGDLELVRRGRVLLRLQFHGEDAARREAIGARIRDGIARASAAARDAAANFVASASSTTVARSAHGGADYRVPSVSRDALWSLVEGQGVHAEARAAAARVLADTGDAPERDRLRVAAERCADPKLRVVLEEFAEDAAHDDDAVLARRAAP